MESSQAILQAAEAGDAARVRQLLEADAGLVEARGDFDRTPLHWAAEGDHLEVASLLLDAGADLEAETSWGHTALDWAANLGCARVGTCLIDRGARGMNLVSAAGLGRLDLVRDFLQATPPFPGRRPPAPQPDDHWPADTAYIRGDALGDAFFAACRNGNLPAAQLLHRHGADPHVTGVFGASALHWAAVGGHADTVSYLLGLGLDPNLADPHFGADAAGWAAEGGHADLAASIQSSGR